MRRVCLILCIVALGSLLAGCRPAGQFVTWLSKDGAVFPPEDVSDQVQQICTERGLELAIAR